MNWPGLQLSDTRHSYDEINCACGHVTRQEPYGSDSRNSLLDIPGSEWRLAGPGLAALIICLAYRMRLSRVRIQEFLHDWLGLELSVGTIHNTLHESGAAAMPRDLDQCHRNLSKKTAVSLALVSGGYSKSPGRDSRSKPA